MKKYCVLQSSTVGENVRMREVLKDLAWIMYFQSAD